MALGVNKTSTENCGKRAFQAKACREKKCVKGERWEHPGSIGTQEHNRMEG